jgi:hypothetical protein
MTYERPDGEPEQPSEALAPFAFMQQLLLKRRLRPLTCPAEMADLASRCAQVQAAELFHVKAL